MGKIWTQDAHEHFRKIDNTGKEIKHQLETASSGAGKVGELVRRLVKNHREMVAFLDEYSTPLHS